MKRQTSQAMIDAARNRPIQQRPWKRHPDYERRLEIIAARRAAGVTWVAIGRELGLSRHRVMQLGALVSSGSRGEQDQNR